MTKQTLKEVCVLLGGGIDSTALIPFYLSRGDTIQGIHFDYGQPSGEAEQRAIREVGIHYDVPVKSIELGLPIVSVSGEYLCRNAVLLLGVASILDSTEGKLSIGIHLGTPYYDCSPSFLTDIQRLLDGYFGGTVQVEAPFLEFTKRDVFNFCLRHRVPVDLTFSCERSNNSCGECSSCKERITLGEGYEGF